MPGNISNGGVSIGAIDLPLEFDHVHPQGGLLRYFPIQTDWQVKSLVRRRQWYYNRVCERMNIAV